MPRCGDVGPWKGRTNYFMDLWKARYGNILQEIHTLSLLTWLQDTAYKLGARFHTKHPRGIDTPHHERKVGNIPTNSTPASSMVFPK